MTRVFLVVAVALAAGLLAVVETSASPYMILPYRVPSMCSGHLCTATGVRVVLPDFDRVELQLTGPAPGVGYVRAGSPSNFVAR